MVLVRVHCMDLYEQKGGKRSYGSSVWTCASTHPASEKSALTGNYPCLCTVRGHGRFTGCSGLYESRLYNERGVEALYFDQTSRITPF